jgi:polysaccharide pyruvyl transferase WcaK-like protein
MGNVVSSAGLAPVAPAFKQAVKARRPRIALLTPYGGGNLGDAAIQDAMIANIRLRLPDVQFSGISKSCENFLDRHGEDAFPIQAVSLRSYGLSPGRLAEQRRREKDSHTGAPSQNDPGAWTGAIKTTLKSVPVLWQCLKVGVAIPQEIRHSIKGYRFLCTQDLLIVSGGGQLSDLHGGAWAHPFVLFKWAVLAGIARVPFAIASVGAHGEFGSTLSRVFLSAALRSARYRSYRDQKTRELTTVLLQRVAADPVVPDLVFSMPRSQLPPPAGIRGIAQRRTVVAISPMAFAKPGRWPTEDRALHDRYLCEMAEVLSQLLRREYFLVIVYSSLFDDESVIPELLARLDDESKQRLAAQMHLPTIATWKDLVATLRDVDLLIASRLHSTILGFVSETPLIAVSFDPKVDWVMQDLGQTDYLLQIGDFTAKDVIDRLDRLMLCKNVVSRQIASYRHRIASVFAKQYDTLAEFATTSSGGQT